jgi:transcriptional regulator with XRE-family HTH domain
MVFEKGAIPYKTLFMRRRGEQGDALQRLFCLNLRQFRANLGWSQEDLAEKAEVSLPFLGAVERGEKWPGPQTIASIALALGVEPYDLFKPEGAAVRNVRETLSGLVKNLSALMNETVYVLNTIARDD